MNITLSDCSFLITSFMFKVSKTDKLTGFVEELQRAINSTTLVFHAKVNLWNVGSCRSWVQSLFFVSPCLSDVKLCYLHFAKYPCVAYQDCKKGGKELEGNRKKKLKHRGSKIILLYNHLFSIIIITIVIIKITLQNIHWYGNKLLLMQCYSPSTLNYHSYNISNLADCQHH